MAAIERGGSRVTAHTSGGLLKGSHQFTPEQQAVVRRVATERGISESAAVRVLLGLGWRVYERLTPATAPVEALAVDLVAQEK